MSEVRYQKSEIRNLKSDLDERTGLNESLVYRLCHQVNRRVAMFGRDKR